MKTLNWASSYYCTEIFATDGPTGEFVEVEELAVQDYGGNELWRGRPGDQPAYQIPTRLIATKTGQRVAGADNLI